MSDRLLRGDFLRLFLANSTSTFGTVISGLALQFLLIGTLDASQGEIGLVRGAQYLPYLVLGLLGGVIADRMRRRPLLIGADIVSMVVYATIGITALTGHLTIWGLSVLVFVAGAVTTVSVATYQAYMPSLAPRHLVGAAFARESQMFQVASSAGPLVAGALVRVASAPIALLVDAASFLVSAVFTISIRGREPKPVVHDRRVLADLREGARWVYRHRQLRPYAISLHIWFLGHAILGTIEVHFAQTELHLGEVTIGLALAVVGVVSVLSAGLGERLSRRYGLGKVVLASLCCAPVGTTVIALSTPGTAGTVVFFVGHAICGGGAAWGSLTMAYRTVVTPDRLRARMNATIRTVNWGGLAIASLAGGLLAGALGDRTALLVAAAFLLISAVLLARSPFTEAQMSDGDEVG